VFICNLALDIQLKKIFGVYGYSPFLSSRSEFRCLPSPLRSAQGSVDSQACLGADADAFDGVRVGRAWAGVELSVGLSDGLWLGGEAVWLGCCAGS
jgi:hypothetical protein